MSVPSENVSEVVDRKELLEQQFEQAENTEQPAEIAARDDSGKFVKQETAEEPVWKRPPASWKKDYHEAWATADPRIQEYAWQREEQMRKGVQPLLSKAQYADDMQKVMAPYENTIRGLGMEPTQAVKALMEADHTLRTTNGEQRAAYFRQLAQQYGVSLDGNSNFPQVDQNYSSLQNELIDLRGKLTSWEQQTEAQQNQVLLNEIDQFSQGAEHFESVRPTMIQLLQGGVAETLQEAYDKAVRIDDNLYESMVQSQQAEKASKRSADLNRAAKAARSAAVSVRSSTPGTNTAPKAQDRRSLLAEQFDGISDRL
tara:strand:- start:537 stop:1478 length:942 start_codon:yes stop_codon:yes gene_type:complete